MMDSFKRRNKALEHSLTHAKIVNEYENKVWSLKRENKRLNVYKEKIENVRYLVNSRIYSLRNSLKRKPNEIKQAQLELLLDIREELK